MLWEKSQKLLRLQRDFATSQFLNKGIFLGELLLVQPSVEVVGGKGEIKVNNLAALFADNKTLLSDIF